MIEYDVADEDPRVMEWEIGLPTADDLTPLSQLLIPPELASAFSITPEPCRSMLDVNRASQETLSALRPQAPSTSNNFDLMPFDEGTARNSVVVEEDEADLACDGSESRKMRRIDSGVEEADSSLPVDNGGDDPCGKALKRPRLVWTPQLHKRFVDVVAHLGIKNAVPKTIMQLMNVEGLTRENVASHLQKYRLYLKRMQGLSNEGPSSSDHLFASTPVPQSLHESSGHSNGHVQMPIPMPYPPQMMPMPMIGHGHMGMGVGNSSVPGPYSHGGFESYQYGMMAHKDWALGKFGSPRHHVTSKEK